MGYRDEAMKQEVVRMRQFNRAGTYRQQAAHFRRRIRNAAVEYEREPDEHETILPSESIYFYVTLYDLKGNDDMTTVRFADHAQGSEGGFRGYDASGTVERHAASDICCDESTGITWRDVAWWLGI